MLGILQQDHRTVRSDLKLLNEVQQWFEEFCHKY
ncbi:anti-sigma regulatory factor, partial [Dolichospermum circinale CS-545/17]|nr:anti-sigma regulatory factor [Dolichospermum circinale CS-545/17]